MSFRISALGQRIAQMAQVEVHTHTHTHKGSTGPRNVLIDRLVSITRTAKREVVDID